MNRLAGLIGGTLLGLAIASSATAQGVDPALKGSYAPGGDCTKEPRVTIGDAITIVSGGKPARFGPVDSCHSCVGGAAYQGAEVWVTYLDSKREPVYPMFRVNADEKRGNLVVDKQDAKTAPPPVRAVAMASPLKRCGK
jgi:hypothetical protein